MLNNTTNNHDLINISRTVYPSIENTYNLFTHINKALRKTDYLLDHRGSLNISDNQIRISGYNVMKL